MDNDEDVFTISKGNYVAFQKSLFLNVICVTHICSQKDYFNSLNNKISGKLSLDDDSKVEVIDAGKMKAKAIYTLEDVLYILKIKNLILLIFRFLGLWL